MADNEIDEQEDEQDGNPDLRALRRAARERDDLAKRLAGMERELAFSKAGLDLSDSKLKYFIKGYDGELTPEAIRTQAEEDGFLAKRQPETSSDEVDGQRRIANASSGAGEMPPPNFRDLLADAKSPEEVMELAAKHGMPTTWNRHAD